MKYLENLGLGKGNIINLDDVQNGLLGKNCGSDLFLSDICDGFLWNRIGDIEKDLSFRKTIEGNKIYDDVK